MSDTKGKRTGRPALDGPVEVRVVRRTEERVATLHGFKAALVERTFQVGKTLDDIAAALGVSKATAARRVSSAELSEDDLRTICDVVDWHYDDIVEQLSNPREAQTSRDEGGEDEGNPTC